MHVNRNETRFKTEQNVSEIASRANTKLLNYAFMMMVVVLTENISFPLLSSRINH